MQKEEKTVSIIIKTFNSDKTLTDTLESVREFGEIIAVDSHSTDDTIDILKEYRTKIIYTDRGELDIGLNQALQEAKGSWILILEDDEIVPQKLLYELEDYMTKPKKNKFCVSLSKKLFYLKKEIKSAKIKSQLKFFKKDNAKFKGDNTFSLVVTNGKIYKLNKNFKKKNTYIMKFFQNDIKKIISDILNRNSDILKSTKKTSSCVIFKPCFEFIYRYFLKLGFLDGKRGFIYSKTKSIERFILEVMKYEKNMKEKL